MAAYFVVAAFVGVLLCIVLWLAYHGGKVGSENEALKEVNKAYVKAQIKAGKISRDTLGAVERGRLLMRDMFKKANKG